MTDKDDEAAEHAAKLMELHTTELIKALFETMKKSPYTFAQVAASSALMLLAQEAAKHDPLFANDEEQLDAARKLAIVFVNRFTKDLDVKVDAEQAKKPQN
jgi:hypothetical protein